LGYGMGDEDEEENKCGGECFHTVISIFNRRRAGQVSADYYY